MNCLIKKPKTRQKQASNLNSKFRKTPITTSAMVFKTSIVNYGNNSSTNSKQHTFKLGNKNNNNNNYSGVKSFESSGDLYNFNNHNSIEEKETKVDEISLNTDQNILTNNYDFYISKNIMYNNYNKKALAISSRNLNKTNNSNIISIKNIINNSTIENESSFLSKNEFIKLKSNDLNDNTISSINYKNYINVDDTSRSVNNLISIKKNTYNQRCRHKQVKREIYLYNNNNKYLSNSDIFNSSRKIRHNIIDVSLSNKNIVISDNKKNCHNAESKENISEEKNINNNKLVKKIKKGDCKIKLNEKFNSSEVLKNTNNQHIIKSNKIKKFLPENGKLHKKIETDIEKNKSSKTSKKNIFGEKTNKDSVKTDKQEKTLKKKNNNSINIELQNDSLDKINKNNIHLKNPFIRHQIKKKIPPIFSYLNLDKSCNNFSQSNNSINKITNKKRISKDLKDNLKKNIKQKLNSKENIPEICGNNAYTIEIANISSDISNKSRTKRLKVKKVPKNQIIKSKKMVKNIINNFIVKNENNIKQSNYKNNPIFRNESSFNEEEFDEKTISAFKKKNIGEKKKFSNKINKILNFETGTSENFNAYRFNGKKISADKNPKLQNITDKNNLKVNKDKKLLSQGNNINKEISNDNLNNINTIIKKNLDYNKKLYNKRNKKCLIKKNKKLNEINNINNGQETTTRNSNNDFLTNKNEDEEVKNKNNKKEENHIKTPYIYSSDNVSSSMNSTIKIIPPIFINHRKIKYKNNFDIYGKFLNVLNIKRFIILYIEFCDLDSLNKFSLLNKKIYNKIKPEIYERIRNLIYKNNKFIKNSKIKKKFMNYSPLSKLSSILLHKKYMDLLYETNNKYDEEIKKDLTRTFPDNALFNYGCENYNKLYNILTTYSNFNKNIGYVQGLNFLAAHIIYLFESEVEEFVFLDALIKKYNFDNLLGVNSNDLSLKLESISNFINKNVPQISQYFSSMRLNFSFFTTNWVLTLFANSMNNKYLFYVWDFMIIFGWKFFKCFVVAVLKNFEKNILNIPQSKLNLLMKNILKSDEFTSKFKNIISDSMEYMIKIGC